ncbi:uncharacterized protein K452DRAFT_77900 [Aplosporella prunicola CBS 121167]|uniref:Uncharacterized protein n=1 Tax=Aplosporella prunicola CBS 121167 TaxID=1176127 RepID=A0A6A6AVZ3_9PEZI|nr:uncharacterized protein K452DRAFT_77900 [Aplosporella prunicola CBS 121167]KAF2135124.1 hypothetical protein K452DRAFT_77900 [Aplosporella prunicola CBS 121167]
MRLHRPTSSMQISTTRNCYARILLQLVTHFFEASSHFFFLLSVQMHLAAFSFPELSRDFFPATQILTRLASPLQAFVDCLFLLSLRNFSAASIMSLIFLTRGRVPDFGEDDPLLGGFCNRGGALFGFPCFGTGFAGVTTVPRGTASTDATSRPQKRMRRENFIVDI